MTTSLSYDIVVVGGGVAGLFAAYTLSREGFRVALIEQKSEREVGDKVCGDAIGKHHFIELGLDLPTLGFDAEGIFRGVKVVSPDEKHVITVYGDGYALNRKNFGLRLFRMAINSGTEAYLSHSFVKPLIEYTWVKGVVVRDYGGGRKEIRARVVIDASGVTAVVRRSLPKEWWVAEEIPREDYNVTYREIWVGDIDVEKEYAWIFLNVDIAPGGYWWLFPKGSGVYNVGLGVQWKAGNPNPLIQFNRYIRPRFQNRISEVVHRGGGLVPTRRPIPCMVWNGFVVVGDAACTANPVHGGGIGSAMLSAKIASEVITEALNRGQPSMENLWDYHSRYHRAYGAKQASLDVLRMFLQTMSNEGLNFVFRSKLVDGVDVYDIGAKGVLTHNIMSRVGALVKLATKPRFLTKLIKLKQFMDRARELYLNYPRTPQEYERWRREEIKLFEEYREWLSKEA